MKFDPKKTIFLIDGSSFLYRAYYSLRPLHTPAGIPVQAVYSFCRMIKKLLDDFSPSYIALVWDSRGKTIRHEMYTAYKATRQEPPSDLFDQKEFIVKFADLIGMKQLAQRGLEADDIMYSVAQERKKNKDVTVFITSDKDMGQALDDLTMIFDPFKGHTIDAHMLEEKMGFSVKKLPFYFALLGDTSDNIPGVKGIGKKSAVELVQHFDSLDDLYANIEKVKKERVRNALEENRKNAFLSRQLFLLHYEPTGLKKEDFLFNRDNWQNARPLFEELNFKTLLKGLPHVADSEKKEDKLAQYDFKAVITREALHDLCTLLKKKKIFALDTETDGTKPLQNAFVGISFCVEEGTSYYIPFGHKTDEVQLPQAEVLAALKPILEDQHYKKYLHHAKFDQLVLYNAGINLAGVDFDSFVAARLILKEWQRAGLKPLSHYYFNEPMLTFDEVVKQNNYKNFSYVPLDLATRYAAADAHQTLKLTKVLKQTLEKAEYASVAKLYYDIELPLIYVLFKMEAEGIFLDKPILAALDKDVTCELEAIEHDIHALISVFNEKINLNSPKQVELLLFSHLKLPPQKRSIKGTGYSTDQEVLKTLSTMHPVPGLILKFRELSKLKSTYIDALPTFVNPKTGRLHTTYNQASTATGRLASVEPNLQNIPVVGHGIEVRAAFKPKVRNIFLSADYSQIELRVLAYLSQDETLVNAFLQGLDIHTETAARLFDVLPENVTHDQRQLGKRINFSILYGLTPYGLSKDLGIPFKDAKYYIEKYFEQYPGVSEWMEGVVRSTEDTGFVETLWGRKRYIPGIYEKNRSLYEEAKRIAVNTKAQGTAAELMKIGMLRLDKALQKLGFDTHILLQIHDELLLTVPEMHINEAEVLVKKILEGVVDWNVPLKVSTKRGKDWKAVTK